MIVNVRLSDTDSFTQEVIDNPPNVDSTIRMGGYLKPVNLRDSDGHTFPSAHREALFIATYLRQASDSVLTIVRVEAYIGQVVRARSLLEADAASKQTWERLLALEDQLRQRYEALGWRVRPGQFIAPEEPTA